MNILDFLSQKTKRDKTELILIIGVSGLLLLIVIGLVISHFFGDGANNYDVVSVQYGASQTEHTQAQHSVETQMLYSNNEGNNNDKSNDNQDSNQNSQKNSQQNSNQNSQQNSQTNANGNHQQAETLEEHSNNNIDNAENHRENNTANNAENNLEKVNIAEEILPENNVANNAENTNIQIAQQKEDIEQLQQQLQQLQQQLQQQKQQQNDIINNINNNNNNNNQFQESFATENVTENADTNTNIASVNYTNNNENNNNNNNNNNNFIEENNETDGKDNTQNNQQNNNNINIAELDTLNVSSGQFDNVETLSQSISQQLNMLENEKRIVREQRSKNAKEDSKYGSRRVLKNFINFNDFLIATKHYEYYVSFSLKVILTSPNYKKRFTDTNKDMLHNSIMKIMEQQDIKTFKNDKEMLAQQVKDLINGFFHQPNLVKEVEFKNFLIQESRI